MKYEKYAELVKSHKDRIYSHALYSLRDVHDAEDVTQETFLKLWHSYDEIDSVRVAGWLTKVVHNLCIDMVRRRKSQQKNFGHPDAEAVDTLPSVTKSYTDPEHGLERDEQQQTLINALATLPAETQSVMIMHYFQEMKLHEIGEALGKSVSALKVQIHRARKSLRLVLMNDGENSFPTKAPAKRGIG
ncbi:MAG: RNA polymerase sigma-70 factor (ECF subfamily) [Candidatus Krumholzibacteriia bacterium]|jgi:RNA polymerase sigma-70 factor (ECF subfamily)